MPEKTIYKVYVISEMEIYASYDKKDAAEYAEEFISDFPLSPGETIEIREETAKTNILFKKKD